MVTLQQREEHQAGQGHGDRLRLGPRRRGAGAANSPGAPGPPAGTRTALAGGRDGRRGGKGRSWPTPAARGGGGGKERGGFGIPGGGGGWVAKKPKPTEKVFGLAADEML